MFQTLSRRLLGLAGLAAVIAVIGLSVQSSQQVAVQRTPIHIVTSAALLRKDVPQLAKEAKLIIIGTVSSTDPSRWNTPDGQLPPNTTAETLAPDLVIFHDVELTIDTVIKGDKQDTIKVRVFGGQVGQDTVIYGDDAPLIVGEKYLLFLEDDTALTASIGPTHYLVLGAIQGAYHVQGDVATSKIETRKINDLLDEIRKYVSASSTVKHPL